MGNDFNLEKIKKQYIFHHKRSFMGCFSLKKREDIDYEDFKLWKNNPLPLKTKVIAETIIPFITNYYDFITTAPPSKSRNLNNYCCFKLCETISEMVNIPFVISFQKRKEKSRHGRFASIEAEQPLLMPGWEYRKKSILFIDDFITSGMTAKTCYEVLRKYDNHIDGLIYCKY